VIKPLNEEDIQSFHSSNPGTDDPAAAATNAVWQTDIDTARYMQYEDGYEEPPLSPEEAAWTPVPNSASDAKATADAQPAELPVKEEEKPADPPAGAEQTETKTVTDVSGVEDVADVTEKGFVQPPVIMAPLPPLFRMSDQNDVKLVTVTIKASGEKDRDMRRIRRVHGLLNSFPGRDRFCFLVFEHGYRHLLDFPNDSTNVNTELIGQLSELVGRDNIRVENI